MNQPGPGAYDAKTYLTKDKQPNVLFSGGKNRSSMVNKEESEKPGPGKYDINAKKTGPSFTFGNKVSQKYKEDIPGPGNYNPDPQVTKSRVLSAKIAKDSI